MKQVLFIGALLIVSSFVSFGQQTKSIVGKWKFSKVVIEGMTIDIDNPAATRKELEKQIEKESGQKPDPAMVDMAMEGMMAAFKDSYMEFTKDGKAIWSGAAMGESKSDIATYTVDNKAGTITTISKDKKKDVIRFRFVGNNLVLDKKEEDKPMVITLRKA